MATKATVVVVITEGTTDAGQEVHAEIDAHVHPEMIAEGMEVIDVTTDQITEKMAIETIVTTTTDEIKMIRNAVEVVVPEETTRMTTMLEQKVEIRRAIVIKKTVKILLSVGTDLVLD